MFEIPIEEVVGRLKVDNPWWEDAKGVGPYFDDLPRRSYFNSFKGLIAEKNVRRALVLMGPRRVGKTVMIHHAIQKLITDGVQRKFILYTSADTPTYTGLNLEKIIMLFCENNKLSMADECYIFIDEIQYIQDWEIYLKSLVDTYKSYKFVASGSSAAALKLKSRESGAGRFTDFMLPPLTFSEYLRFVDKESELIVDEPTAQGINFRSKNIIGLNKEFINYLNYGGYPEAVMNKAIQENPSRYIKSDIIDKVLLKDLPNLYGIQNIQELNKLLSTIAYNTGNELSLDALSQSSGVAKNTIKKYLEYLKAAFLIIIIQRVDESCKSFKRENFFKVYLTNPSMRSALFHNIKDGDNSIGNLTETAIVSQWLHWGKAGNIRYSRWKGGEVDIVHIKPESQKPSWAYEIKWSDSYYHYPKKLKSLIKFAKKNDLSGRIGATTKTIFGSTTVDEINITHFPCSFHCYKIGRNITEGRAP